MYEHLYDGDKLAASIERQKRIIGSLLKNSLFILPLISFYQTFTGEISTTFLILFRLNIILKL
jgi:hypothetical protein